MSSLDWQTTIGLASAVFSVVAVLISAKAISISQNQGYVGAWYIAPDYKNHSLVIQNASPDSMRTVKISLLYQELPDSEVMIPSANKSVLLKTKRKFRQGEKSVYFLREDQVPTEFWKREDVVLTVYIISRGRAGVLYQCAQQFSIRGMRSHL